MSGRDVFGQIEPVFSLGPWLVGLAVRVIAGGLVGLALGALVDSARGETLNEARAANGLRPLVVSGELAAYAQSQASQMAAVGRKCSYDALWHNTDSSTTRAENVSCGCTNATCAVQSWLRSRGHRANILARWATRYGIASARSSSGATFWAMEIRP